MIEPSSYAYLGFKVRFDQVVADLVEDFTSRILHRQDFKLER